MFYLVIFSLIFTGFLAVFTALVKYLGITHYGTILGLIALGIEATLGIPQLLQNQKIRSVAGLSTSMISIWFIGDFLKTLYFVIEVPIPLFRINHFNSFFQAPFNWQSIR